MFKKVLIANRGEIAVRVAHTLREMGIAVVAVFSEPDAAAMHVAVADEAYPLAGQTAAETYLQADRIIEIAKKANVDAIHPGFGFLSENADFARSCEKAGITFIGPTPDVIMAMGDKITAKRTMEEANVPIVPGWAGDTDASISTVQAEADRIGYPLLCKAAAGGGGKGMRRVDDPKDLESAWEAAAREAGSAFGDARVFLEKYIEKPRHVEFQIFGDTHGNVVHLFERECSIQRRYQKIIEETPSPALTPELRQMMGKSAIAAGKALNYTNAGTVEFILAPDGKYYFLEVNTRLQVEHPVTEMTTHHDLVRAQVLVASGKSLPFTQSDLAQTGHAIECRVYAEDPANNFVPSTGKIVAYQPPQGPNIRTDSGVAAGSEITIYYDPMIAKLVVWAPTREQAIAKMTDALDNFVILGPTTNIPYLRRILNHDEFKAGHTHTHFLTDHTIESAPAAPPIAAYIAAASSKQSTPSRTAATQNADVDSPWHSLGPWRVA